MVCFTNFIAQLCLVWIFLHFREKKSEEPRQTVVAHRESIERLTYLEDCTTINNDKSEILDTEDLDNSMGSTRMPQQYTNTEHSVYVETDGDLDVVYSKHKMSTFLGHIGLDKSLKS